MALASSLDGQSDGYSSLKDLCDYFFNNNNSEVSFDEKISENKVKVTESGSLTNQSHFHANDTAKQIGYIEILPIEDIVIKEEPSVALLTESVNENIFLSEWSENIYDVIKKENINPTESNNFISHNDDGLSIEENSFDCSVVLQRLSTKKKKKLKEKCNKTRNTFQDNNTKNKKKDNKSKKILKTNESLSYLKVDTTKCIKTKHCVTYVNQNCSVKCNKAKKDLKFDKTKGKKLSNNHKDNETTGDFNKDNPKSMCRYYKSNNVVQYNTKNSPNCNKTKRDHKGKNANKTLKLIAHKNDDSLKKQLKSSIEVNKYKSDNYIKTFFKEDELVSHMTSHLKENEIKCDKCEKFYSTEAGLKKHLTTFHSHEKQFECETCGKVFKKGQHLKNHLMSHSGKKPHKCNICNKSFSIKDSLKTHLKCVHGEKKFICDICKKAFSLERRLRTHLLLHNIRKNKSDILLKNKSSTHLFTSNETDVFKCNVCAAKFTLEDDLRSHMQLHKIEESNLNNSSMLERPLETKLIADNRNVKFQCNLCFKTYTRKSNLRLHIDGFHEGKINFECKICGNVFIFKKNLKIHLELHSGEKNFKCNICGKSFARSDYLQKHEITHTGRKNFKCNICGKNYSTKFYLYSHVASVHKEENYMEHDLNKRNYSKCISKKFIDVENIHDTNCSNPNSSDEELYIPIAMTRSGRKT